MKLSTDITPRADGTVIAHLPGGVDYEFKSDRTGRLVADVPDDDHVGFLLDSGNFYPVDEADIKAGAEAVAKIQSGTIAPADAGSDPAAITANPGTADSVNPVSAPKTAATAKGTKAAKTAAQ